MQFILIKFRPFVQLVAEAHNHICPVDPAAGCRTLGADLNAVQSFHLSIRPPVVNEMSANGGNWNIDDDDDYDGRVT